jgi:hypothetical protein
MSTQKTNQNEKPLDYYKLLSDYLRRRYAHKLSIDTWVGGEIDTDDGVVLEEHSVRGKTLYVLYYNGDIVSIYDDALVANEVSRIAHAVLRLERLRRRRSRR